MENNSVNIDQYPSKKSILKYIFLAFGFIMLLFLLFEIVEILWLKGLNMKTLHAYHLFRGISISLISVILISYLILKSSRPLLISEEWSHAKRPAKKFRITHFNWWFIMMRWVAIVIVSSLIFIVVKINKWLPPEVWVPLSITLLALVMLNLVYMIIARNKRMDSFLLPFQVYTDLILLTFLLHFSGGIENPLTMMLLIHVIIAGIILNQTQLYMVTATAILLYSGMAIGEATGILEHYTLNVFPHFEEHGIHIHAAHMPLYVSSNIALMITIFLVTAYFIGTIMRRIRHDEKQLEILADKSLEQKQLIEKSLETTGTGICVLDQNGIPSLINPHWEQWFGDKSSAGRIISREHNSILKTLEDGLPRVEEFIQNKKNEKGKSRVIQVTTAPLLDKDGKFDHAVALASDITHQKEAQEQMLKAGKLAAVGELAGKIAHEVNNPIAIISAKGRLLLSDESDQMSNKVKQEMAKIIDAADRVSEIAKGLLSYCRPSTAVHRPVNLLYPIQNALSMIEQSANKNGVTIDLNIPANLPKVNANINELQQVFLNLFLNSLDAMPDGGNLNIDLVLKGKQAVIQVQDTGIGIPDDLSQKIFEPFFTTKKEGKGTGLGLSICAGLIRSHHGSITVNSSPDKGTTFTISLPLKNNNDPSF